MVLELKKKSVGGNSTLFHLLFVFLLQCRKTSGGEGPGELYRKLSDEKYTYKVGIQSEHNLAPSSLTLKAIRS